MSGGGTSPKALAPPPRSPWRWAAVALAATTFARVVALPFVELDDTVYVVRNPLIEHPLGQGLPALLRTADFGYPIPMTVLSYALDRAVFGMSATAFHAVNLALHLVNVFLVFGLARRVGLTERAASAASAIFAVHPLVVEPVAWVTGRKDLLATALLLAAASLLVRDRDADREPSWKRWLAVDVLGVLGILSKPSALPAPALFYLLVRWARPGWNRRRSLWALVPLAAAAIAIAIVGARGHTTVSEAHARDLAGAFMDVTGALALQLGHLVWPGGLLVTYHRLPGDPSLPACLAALAAVAGAGAYAWRRSPHGSPERFGLLFAAAAYVPFSNLVANFRWVADSYMYLPLAGLGIAMVAAAGRLWARPLREAHTGALLALLLAVLSFRRVGVWNDDIRMFRDEAARYPDSPEALDRLAATLLAKDDPEGPRLFADLDRRFPEFKPRGRRASALAALGNRARAAELLAAGVRDGEDDCAIFWWLDRLEPQTWPTTADRDTAATAFRLAIGSSRLRGRGVGPIYRKIAAALGNLDLPELAAEADRKADALER